VKRGALLSLVAVVVCGVAAGCGSGGPPGYWSQTGEKLRASWTVPSGSSIDLQFTGAVSATSCRTTAKGKSEMGTILIVAGDPAAYVPIGKTLQPGAHAQTTCQVTGTVTGVSYGSATFKHVKHVPAP
jgi:hypothetical protein